MKILIVTPRICPSRYNYYNELGNLCELTVVSELKPESDSFERVLSINKLSFKLVYLNGLVIKDYLSLSFKIFKQLRGNLESTIIIEQYSSPTSMLGIIYLRFLKKPFFLNADGGFINFHESRLKRFIKRGFISSASHYLSSSSLATDYLMYYGADINNISQFPISSSPYTDILNVFSSDRESQAFKSTIFDDGKPIITYVGRFVNEKGYGLFYKLVKSGLIDANFLMIGGQLDHKNYPFNDYHNLKVIDHVSSEEVKKYLYISDLHVIPSRSDVWNYTLIEAYNMGTRVIASSGTGAAVEMLYNKDKFMFNVNDFDEFIQVVEIAIKSNKSAQEIQYYQQMSEKYTSKNMAETIHNILKSIEKNNYAI